MSRTSRFALAVCLVALVAAACGGDEGADASTTSTAAATTTEPADAGASSVTFTGTDCIQSGPTEVASFVQFALRNDAPADVAVMFLQITDITFEELVSDDVTRFPPIDSWPPTQGHHPESVSSKFVEAGDDANLAVSFNEPGLYGSVCYPTDGTAVVPGTVFTVVG